MLFKRVFICVVTLMGLSLVSDIMASTCVTEMPDSLEEESCLPYPYIEAKAGYFFFGSKGMRKVYDQGGLDVELLFGYPIISYLRIYGAFGYIKKSGRSLSADEKTSIWMMPTSLGLQVAIELSKVYPISWYATIGPRYFVTRVSNDSSYVSRIMHANGLGGFANTGFLFQILDHLVLDLFAEGSYVRLHYKTHKINSYSNSVQVGGITFGGGISYAF